MKHFLSVSGLMLMMLSGCAMLPENAANDEVQAASDVAMAQTASEVSAPRVQAASDAVSVLADDVKVLPIHTSDKQDTLAKNNKAEKTEKDKANSSNKTTLNDKNAPAKLNVTLRNQPKTNSNANKTSNKNTKGKVVKMPATVVKLPPPKPAKPVLTRRQILEQEISRERAALKSAQAQLAAAKKSGNAKQIAKLNAAVRDRELNVKAIEAEMKR